NRRSATAGCSKKARFPLGQWSNSNAWIPVSRAQCGTPEVGFTRLPAHLLLAQVGFTRLPAHLLLAQVGFTRLPAHLLLAQVGFTRLAAHLLLAQVGFTRL